MSLPKPHFKQTFVREENGERTITRSAVVETPAGPLRVWMEETRTSAPVCSTSSSP
jgi:hypothetical protein